MEKKKRTKSDLNSLIPPHVYLVQDHPRKSDLEYGANIYITKSGSIESAQYNKLERMNEENQEQRKKIVELNIRLNLLSDEVKELKNLIKSAYIPVSEPLWKMNELFEYGRETVEEVEQLILKELESAPLFPSDFSEKYGFDYKLVYLCFKDLTNKGLIE